MKFIYLTAFLLFVCSVLIQETQAQELQAFIISPRVCDRRYNYCPRNAPYCCAGRRYYCASYTIADATNDPCYR
eukprot:403358719